MFEKLYDDEIISEDAFFLWEKNDDPSEQASPRYILTNQFTDFFLILGGKGRGLEILLTVSYLVTRSRKRGRL